MQTGGLFRAKGSAAGVGSRRGARIKGSLQADSKVADVVRHAFVHEGSHQFGGDLGQGVGIVGNWFWLKLCHDGPSVATRIGQQALRVQSKT